MFVPCFSKSSNEGRGIASSSLCSRTVIIPSHSSYIVKTAGMGEAMNGLSMVKYKQIEERAVEVAQYIIEHNATVRQTAKQFGISKSTVHKDVAERLLKINPALAEEARKVLDINKSERHIRGGLATREKYLHT